MLALWTGIPVYKLTEEETAKLLRMEDELHKRIVGQNDAIKAVSQAIRRTRAGLKDPKRPSGSFIFLGPSGVGKTEPAKTLAEFLFGDESALIQLDMSEYMEKHTVSRLVGSPPGYVGYDEGGQLTEAVRRKPFSVVLFDEIEKAHPDVFNTLLQILEDGRLTDAQGRTVDFKNTVIIMTSNLGTADLRKANIGFAEADEQVTYEKMKEKVHEELKRHFRPEFLNRIDDVIVFNELSQAEVTEIVDLLIKRVQNQLESQGLALELTQRREAAAGQEGLRPDARCPAAAPCDPAHGRGPALGEDPVEGVPRRRDDHRRRAGRRDRLPHDRGGRASAGRAGGIGVRGPVSQSLFWERRVLRGPPLLRCRVSLAPFVGSGVVAGIASSRSDKGFAEERSPNSLCRGTPAPTPSTPGFLPVEVRRSAPSLRGLLLICSLLESGQLHRRERGGRGGSARQTRSVRKLGLLAVCCVLVLSACRVDADVVVLVREDGSGGCDGAGADSTARRWRWWRAPGWSWRRGSGLTI